MKDRLTGRPGPDDTTNEQPRVGDGGHAGAVPVDAGAPPGAAALNAADRDGAAGSAGSGADAPAGPGESGPGDGQASESSGPDAGGPAATGKSKRSRPHRSLWRELPLLVVLAVVIALLIKTFVVQAFFIPSGSMQNTLEINDKILVNKLVYDFRSIQPGDIIVFDGAGSWNPVPPQAKPSSDPFVRAYDATIKPMIHSLIGIFGTAPGQTDYIKRP